MVTRAGEVDRIMTTRFSRADTPKSPITIKILRDEGILPYILNAAFDLGVPRTKVPCPPIERWGQRPLPQPTRLRMCSPIVYESLEACVRGEFRIVQASLEPAIPTQPAGAEQLEPAADETTL